MDCFHAEVYFYTEAHVGKTEQGGGRLKPKSDLTRDVAVRDN